MNAKSNKTLNKKKSHKYLLATETVSCNPERQYSLCLGITGPPGKFRTRVVIKLLVDLCYDHVCTWISCPIKTSNSEFTERDVSSHDNLDLVASRVTFALCTDKRRFTSQEQRGHNFPPFMWWQKSIQVRCCNPLVCFNPSFRAFSHS